MFSQTSEIAAFVTCVYYNRYDWTENLYNVFIVHPETSSNYTIDFPNLTEFVSAPKIVSTADGNYFVSVVQTCRKQVDSSTGKELSRRNEVRLFVQSTSSPNESGEQTLLRVQNLVTDVDDDAEFLDIVQVNDGNVLAVYAQIEKGFEFVTDKGILPPKNLRKGAILLDVEKLEALKHIPVFLESLSRLEGLLISSQFNLILDSDLKVFKYNSTSFQHQITSTSFAAGKIRLAMDGRYVIGISRNQTKIVVVRTADDTTLGSVFVHGKATCLEVADDDRTVVVGCEDGRVMIMSLILELADPLREYIEKLPSRCDDDFDGNLIVSDVRRLSLSTPDQHRLSARLRKSAQAEERRPPSYTTLQRAVTVSRLSNRARSASSCTQQ